MHLCGVPPYPGRGARMSSRAASDKDERVLLDTYNNAAGVTARFNLTDEAKMFSVHASAAED